MSNERFLSGTSGYTPPVVDTELAVLAGRQHGYVHVAQLRALGLGGSAAARRCQRGVLHLVHPGVYGVGHVAPSREGRWMAAVLAGGDGAVLSHLSAAALWDVGRYVPPFPDVLVPRRHRPVAGIMIRTCRRLDPRDVTERRGIPVTTVARMLVDLSDVWPADRLTNVIHEAGYRKRLNLIAVREAMERANGRRHLGVLDEALALYLTGSAGLKSGAEAAFRALLAAFPAPLGNVKVCGYEVDFHWPERKLVVEVDGPGHERPRTRREDARRDRVLTAAGYTVLRFADIEIEQRPAEVVARLARELGGL